MLHNGGTMRDSFQLLCISIGMKNIFIIAIFLILSGLISSKVSAQLSSPAEIPPMVQSPKEDTSATIPPPSPDPTAPPTDAGQSGPIDTVPPVINSPAPTETEVPPVIVPTAPPVQAPQSGGYKPPSGTINTGNSGSTGGNSNSGSGGSVSSTGNTTTQYSPLNPLYPAVIPTLSAPKASQITSDKASQNAETNAPTITTPSPTSQPFMAGISNDPPGKQTIPQQIETIIKSTGSSIPLIGTYLRKPAFAYYPNNQLSTQETIGLLGLSLISFIAGLSLVSSRFPRFIFSRMAVVKSFIL